MRENIVTYCEEKGCLLRPSTLKRLMELEDPIGHLETCLNSDLTKNGIIDECHIFDGTSTEQTRNRSRELQEHITPIIRAEPEIFDEIGSVEVTSVPKIELDINGDPVKVKYQINPEDLPYMIEGNITEFSDYFSDRFDKLSDFFQGRPGIELLVSDPSPDIDGEFSFVGMIQEIWKTKNNKDMYMVDTKFRTVTLMVAPKGDNLSTLMLDDIVCFTGGYLKDADEQSKRRFKNQSPLFYAKNVAYPGVPARNRPKFWKDEAYVAFIGDIHVGSKNFLEKEWMEFIAWLHSDEGEASKIKHLIIAGDLVDGVGIYPGQNKDLELVSFKEQYRRLGELFENIPKHIQIHAIPGNHDAVPLSEPQPPIPQEFQKYFKRQVNFLPNPSWIDLDGIHVLAYHGASIFDFISGIPEVTIKKPLKAMTEMLHRRHLAPRFGAGTPLLPLKQDNLVIDRVPNILVTGHLHVCAANIYSGIVMISASTWQSQTDYQKTQNFSPDPAQVVLVNLKNGKTKIRSFFTPITT